MYIIHMAIKLPQVLIDWTRNRPCLFVKKPRACPLRSRSTLPSGRKGGRGNRVCGNVNISLLPY